MKLPDGGRGLMKSCKTRMAAVAEKTSALSTRPRVACIEWIDLDGRRQLGAGARRTAGGINLLGEAGVHSSWMEWSSW